MRIKDELRMRGCVTMGGGIRGKVRGQKLEDERKVFLRKGVMSESGNVSDSTRKSEDDNT